MLKLPPRELSYWQASAPTFKYPKLRKDKKVDVAIVGAGITGLTAAYLLKQAGFKVAVIEKDHIGSGTSGHTTGKVTSQHGLIYDDLMSLLGEKVARDYAQANQTALEGIETLINKEKIDCGWRRMDNYVFTDQSSQVKQFKAEAKIAAKLGLPATFEATAPLPFKIRGAVKFSNQATFHTKQYLLGLAEAVNGDGSYIFENSRVIGIRDGTPCRVRTSGAVITAKDIIVASNVPTLPLVARGAYCILEYPHTSYIVAGRTSKAVVEGMYISPDEHHYSILPVKNGNERLLLIGGENHITGLRGSKDSRYQKLANYAEERFGIKSIDYKWSARDYMAYDDVPLIGKVYPWSKHLYTATAFRKWGLSTSMVAGIVLTDTIMGKQNPWASTFNSMRTSPIKSIPRVAASYLKPS